jgi:hypothetical protein
MSDLGRRLLSCPVTADVMGCMGNIEKEISRMLLLSSNYTHI